MNVLTRSILFPSIFHLSEHDSAHYSAEPTDTHSMLTIPDQPTLSRVMRVVPPESTSSPPEPRARTISTISEAYGSSFSALALPSSPSSSSQKKPTNAPETMTKKQRQNAARREAEKKEG
ncbi:hypothetical protein K435DRAFT_872916 [Dendrothele bispora CBS 962.96]|uniref:Uncharacterized protein n=1 Tax=Dendrothele bispora (strain CBS 962.96) TaxID=1314807 RepID=A0A4V4HC44_DENBC|nr:hypothetical protein K435DRAFT_872916 [Dendrothele bispora CBS 962.96]